MTVLVTGATGFSGRILVRYLCAQSRDDIAGLARTVTETDTDAMGIRLVPCDLADRPRVRVAIGNLRPHRVIHLAGLNRGTPDELFRANVTGTENLLDAVQEITPACRILMVSSSAVYGYAGERTIGEDMPLRPLSDYGASKAAQEQAALAHHATKGTKVAIVRPFNLVGPGQPDAFLCGRIVRQVVEIERGLRKNLELLETRSYRDFIDVRDAVKGYWAIASHPDFEHTCSGKAFNIGSGTAHSVSEVISLVEGITGRTYVVEMPEDPPVVPIPFQQGDISRIRNATGWKPEISLKDSLADMIEFAQRK